MKRFGLVAIVAALALVIAAPAAASNGKPANAHIAKRCKRKHHHRKCKKPAPAPVPLAPVPSASPTPLALTEAEVVSRVTQQAAAYCSADVLCTSSGHYFTNADPSTARCSSKTTYSWRCEGWKLQSNSAEPPILTQCDFFEVVERDGYDGIKSHQDTSFGSGGWDCNLVV